MLFRIDAIDPPTGQLAGEVGLHFAYEGDPCVGEGLADFIRGEGSGDDALRRARVQVCAAGVEQHEFPAAIGVVNQGMSMHARSVTRLPASDGLPAMSVSSIGRGGPGHAAVDASANAQGAMARLWSFTGRPPLSAA